MAIVLTNITKVDNLFTVNFSIPKENIEYKHEELHNLIKQDDFYESNKPNCAYEI